MTDPAVGAVAGALRYRVAGGPAGSSACLHETKQIRLIATPALLAACGPIAAIRTYVPVWSCDRWWLLVPYDTINGTRSPVRSALVLCPVAHAVPVGRSVSSACGASGPGLHQDPSADRRASTRHLSLLRATCNTPTAIARRKSRIPFAIIRRRNSLHRISSFST